MVVMKLDRRQRERLVLIAVGAIAALIIVSAVDEVGVRAEIEELEPGCGKILAHRGGEPNPSPPPPPRARAPRARGARAGLQVK